MLDHLLDPDDEEEEGVWEEPEPDMELDIWDDLDFDEGAALDAYERNQ